MHVHSNQFDPNLQLNAMYAATQAEAKLAAERTRKRLLSAASALAGQCDDAVACVVSLSEHNASQEQSDPQNREDQSARKKQSEQANPDGAGNLFSDWA